MIEEQEEEAVEDAEEVDEEEDEADEADDEVEGILASVPVAAYCSTDGIPPLEYCCSVDGTLVRLAVVAYCSADGTLVTVPVLEYCSTETVLVRLPPPPAPMLAPLAACCSVDGILVRVPRLLAEQLVDIVDIDAPPPNATDLRFGL